jgi:hypothetical protein
MNEMRPRQYLDVVFDGPPGPEGGTFVEVESPAGVAVHVGEWVQPTPDDSRWRLRLTLKDFGEA